MLIIYKKEHGAIANIVVRFTENNLNRGEFSKFKEYFSNFGIDYINYTLEHSFAGVNPNLVSKDSAKYCGQPFNVINFNFLGELTTCCVNWRLNPTFGNIKNQSLKKLWQSPQKIIFNENTRMHTVPCVQCSGLGGVQHSKMIKMGE